MHALVPLILAVSGLPSLLIGAWVSRAPDHRSRGMALHWVLIGLTIQAGAVGTYWAADRDGWVHGIVIAMVVLVNALIVSMVLQLRRNGTPR
ncbi:hypothetical protein J2X02_001947 [Pseudoxanthomonas japonensis]|uniref:hypothetical protein n=1 Tax=Pseudoxanthomonas TaxID=83618 RepID=UPI000785B2B9|nr:MULTISPECIES: hypothetical protein [Pseudoxanthomonas]MBA3929140.1 hypothetical protein [Xanthomonas sp.]MBL8256402.1 hypothetical protein [Pseudoxanthomonas mexicana]MDR7069096.1 hypothetical protein [Pseudoxanthomonas japonensis]